MGRHKKHHDPIPDTFENVVDILSKTPVENKRVKKEKEGEEGKSSDSRESEEKEKR